MCRPGSRLPLAPDAAVDAPCTLRCRQYAPWSPHGALFRTHQLIDPRAHMDRTPPTVITASAGGAAADATSPALSPPPPPSLPSPLATCTRRLQLPELPPPPPSPPQSPHPSPELSPAAIAGVDAVAIIVQMGLHLRMRICASAAAAAAAATTVTPSFRIGIAAPAVIGIPRPFAAARCVRLARTR